MASREIVIPVANSDLGVAVPLDALPDDEADVLQILQAEQAPLGLWLDFAKAYLQQGREEQARRMLEDGCSDEIEQYYGDAKAERVALLCASASFYTRLGRLEKEKGARDALYERANVFVLQAMRLDPSEQLPWLARGHQALARHNLEEATRAFSEARSRRHAGAESVAPLLGLGCCALARGSPTDALRHFGDALRRHPACGAAPRLGMGAALLRLGKPQRAAAAFRRAAAVDPGSAEAQLGLALATAAEQGCAAGAEASAAALRAAYAAAPRLTPALLLLSEHAALAGRSGAADALAKAVQSCADTPPLRAAAALQSARLAHAGGRPAEASRLYAAALALAPQDAVPSMGLGLVALAREEVPAATAALERAAAGAPGGEAATRRALGHLLAGSADAERRARAPPLLRAAAAAAPGDAGCAAELSLALAASAPAEAYAAAQAALAARRAGGRAPSVSLLSNAGALAAAAGGEGALDAARSHYAAALEAAGAPWAALPPAQWPPAASLAGPAAVVAFNAACLEQDAGAAGGDPARAAALLELLRRDCPSDGVPLLRTAVAAARAGDTAAADSLAAAAAAAAPRSADAAALTAAAASTKRDWRGAVALADAFRKGAGGAGAHAADEHLMLVAANALLADARRDGAGAIGDSGARREGRLERALALFGKALARAPRNAYAANGVGAVLAERGRLAEAARVFSSVAEACQGDPALEAGGLGAAALLNAAHCTLGLGAPARAVRLYEAAARHALAPDASALLCEARALHEWRDAPGGDAAAGDARLRAARSALARALHIAPCETRARFDAAFIAQEQAVRALARFRESAPGSTDRSTAAEAAGEAAAAATRAFRALAAAGEAGATPGLDPKRTAIHAAFCSDALSRAAAARQLAIREAEASAARRAAHDAERAAAAELARAAAEGAAAVEAEKQRRLEVLAAKNAEQAQRRGAEAKGDDGEKPVSKGSKKRPAARKGKAADREDDGEEEEAAEPEPARDVEMVEPEPEAAVEAPRRRLRRAGEAAAEADPAETAQPLGNELDDDEEAPPAKRMALDEDDE